MLHYAIQIFAHAMAYMALSFMGYFIYLHVRACRNPKLVLQPHIPREWLILEAWFEGFQKRLPHWFDGSVRPDCYTKLVMAKNLRGLLDQQSDALGFLSQGIRLTPNIQKRMPDRVDYIDGIQIPLFIIMDADYRFIEPRDPELCITTLARTLKG